MNVFQSYRNSAFSIKRWTAGQHLIQDTTNRINVSRPVNRLPFSLFRGNIMYRPNNIIAIRYGGIADGAGNPEISYLYHPVLGDEYIMWFNVAMYDSFFMRVMYPITNHNGNIGRMFYRQRRLIANDFF